MSEWTWSFEVAVGRGEYSAPSCVSPGMSERRSKHLDADRLLLHRTTTLPDVIAILLANHRVRSDAHLDGGPALAASVLQPETVLRLVDKLWPPGIRPTPATPTWQLARIRQNMRVQLERIETLEAAPKTMK